MAATGTELLLSKLMSLLAVAAGLPRGNRALRARGVLYGLVASSVAERRLEVGVRMALGADRAGVVGTVVGDALRLVGLGLAVGAGPVRRPVAPMGVLRR